MRQKSLETRSRIVAAAYGLFYARGFARVSMDDIAATAGIAKRTLYAHFPSKDDLAGVAAEQHMALAQERIAKWCAGLADDAPSGIEALFDDLERWTSEPRWAGSGFTRIAMELADLPGHPVRAAAALHKKAVEDALSAALGNRETALKLAIILEGAMDLLVVSRRRDALAVARMMAREIIERNEAQRLGAPSRSALQNGGSNRLKTGSAGSSG